MNQSKFSLADVLTVLSAISFGFVCFLGANFLNIDSEKVWGMSHTTGCIMIALFCSLLLFTTSYGAKRLKRTDRNFKTSFIAEVILLFLFAIFAVLFAMRGSPFPHYFSVTAQKSEINNKLQAGITQAEKMFEAYESYAENRKIRYRNTLQTVIAGEGNNPDTLANYGFRPTKQEPGDSQIVFKMLTIQYDLFPTNYSDSVANNGIKEIAKGWLQEAKSTTSSWKPIGIVNVVNAIEKNTNDWLNTLVSFSTIREVGEQAMDFNYQLSFADVKMHFFKTESPSALSYGLSLLAYLLMLLSWAVAKRSTRFPGLKLLFGMGKSRDNEL
ncbi:MAG: hypothetical protein KKD31_19085 [Bacteroidetes bacterium]|nr:hypothetical protein [Bacteroidota bacterium]